MTVAVMIAAVLAATQFIKNAILSMFQVTIEKKYAVILSCIIALVVTIYGTWPLDAKDFITFIEVAIGANAGYSLLKVARNQ